MHVEQGQGACRADALHEVLVTMGFTGALRSTQRAVKAVKAEYHLGQGRKHRPWVPEPGLWVQFDYGDGPVIEGKKTTLFVAWFPWSRFRVVIPLRDKTYGSVFAALAETFTRAGGVPTFVLTDNEKTVTTKHIAGAPVRSPMMVDFSRHYGTTVHTCTVADPQSKGGSESSVKLAKADLLPRPGNFRPEYTSFEDLTRACHTWCEEVNHRVHTVTRATPVSLLEKERPHFHALPTDAFTPALGVSRRVPVNTPMVSFEGGQYSVPETWCGREVFVRAVGGGQTESVVIMTLNDHGGATEIARHQRALPGQPHINDDHFPTAARRRAPGEYRIVPTNRDEAAFVALGDGAVTWLREAAAAAFPHIRHTMAHATSLTASAPASLIDEALGLAAVRHRFTASDLDSLLTVVRRGHTTNSFHTAGEEHSLNPGTTTWAGYTTEPDTQPSAGDKVPGALPAQHQPRIIDLRHGT